MKVLALVVVICAVAVVYAAAPPALSETFQAKVDIYITSRDRGNDTGHGVWAQDTAAQSAVEDFSFDKGTFDSFSLDRYDLGKLYRVFSTNKSRCDIFPVNEKMPLTWGWVAQSKLIGQEKYDGKDVDVWEFNQGFAIRRIAVYSNSTTTPAWQLNRGNERDTLIVFSTFTSSAPATSVFDVPTVCKVPTARPPRNQVGCMSSAEIMKNAEIWVANKVPYNQAGRYMNYRTDCSGYVSFTWQSGAPGLDTEEFHEQSHPITKAELVPGDCMLYAGEHVALFGGWTDAAKTHYWAYEETQPCSDNPNWCGTRKDNIVYPYYYDPSDFLPYRYNNFC